MREKTRYVLSIDGGGMRGIIPGHVLGALSRLVREEGDKRPLYAHFDLIAGTSTGALLSFALVSSSTALPIEPIPPLPVYRRKLFRKTIKGYIAPCADPETLSGLYLDYGSKIFTPSFFPLYPVLGEKYDSDALEELLLSWFGDATLSSLHVPVLSVTYEPQKGRIRMLKSWEDSKVLIREAARASTAAPAYFAPEKLEDGSMLIDGGIAANNPSLLAYAEAKRLYPDAKQFRILSLSTCSSPYRFKPDETLGGITWASPVIKLYGDASLEIADRIAEAVPDLEYTRIWSDPGKRTKMDATDKDELAHLQSLADRAVEENKGKLEAYAKGLSRRRLPERLLLKENL